MSETNIESLLKEQRVFSASPEFAKQAHIHSGEVYESICKRAADDPEGFWSDIAGELHWFAPWSKVLEWDLPFAKWFVDGQTNISYNCLDRHLTTPRKNKAAIIWEGEPGDVRALSYQMLHYEVCRFANVLKSLGIHKGDRATIYMGMVPELAIAMLACARLGITKNVDDALTDAPSIQSVIVYKRTGDAINMVEGRDLWWHNLTAKMSGDCAAE